MYGIPIKAMNALRTMSEALCMITAIMPTVEMEKNDQSLRRNLKR